MSFSTINHWHCSQSGWWLISWSVTENQFHWGMCTLCDVTKAVQVIGNLIFFTIWNLTANIHRNKNQKRQSGWWIKWQRTGFLLALRQNKPGSIQIIPLMLPYGFALTEEKHDVIAVKCTRQTRYIYPVWNVSMQHGWTAGTGCAVSKRIMFVPVLPRSSFPLYNSTEVSSNGFDVLGVSFFFNATKLYQIHSQLCLAVARLKIHWVQNKTADA